MFANQSGGAPAGAATAEQFRSPPTLSLTASRFLVDPALVAGNKGRFDGESVVDEYGRQIITI